MITNFSKIVNESLGRTLSLPAHGRVGARATSTLAAHFAMQNTHSKSAEKRAVGSEGEAEGGCGGNSASPEPKRSPATLLVRSRPPKKSFVFLLEKNQARANKKFQTKLFFGGASKASGGGAERIIGRFAQKMFELRSKNTAVRTW